MESNILKIFTDFLEARKGYPQDSLMREMAVGKGMRADLMIIDPDSREPLAIFEFKGKSTSGVSDSTLVQIKRYKEQIGYPNIPSYIVTEEGSGGFTVYQHAGDKVAILIPEYIPTYQSLLNRGAVNRKTEVKTKTKSTIDHFKLTCYVSAFLVTVVLILDITGSLKLSTQQLSLLGIVVALVLIPYAAKLKILGIEFERNQKDKNP